MKYKQFTVPRTPWQRFVRRNKMRVVHAWWRVYDLYDNCKLKRKGQ